MTKKIKVMVIDFYIRIRDFKQVLALGDLLDIVFVKTTERVDNIDKIRNKVYTTNNFDRDIMKLIKAENPDIIHTHVDSHADYLLRQGINIPIIHECHDPKSAYDKKPKKVHDRERFVMTGVDKVICVGHDMVDYLHRKHGIADKCHIIYSYPNKALLPKQKKPPLSYVHGVYQGGMGHYKRHHRYYGNIMKSLSGQGLTVDTYSSHGHIDYNIQGITPKPFISDVAELYSTLSRYDFGFVGFNPHSLPLLNMAMPNKLFEYIACGIPVIAMDYDSMSRFVTQHGVGIVIGKDLILPRKFNKRMSQAHAMVIKHRGRFTMESQVNDLMDIYRSVL